MDDALSAIAAGAVGAVVVMLILLVTEVTLGFGAHIFLILAEVFGSESLLLGMVLFFSAGLVMWPLLFITLGRYLPGEGPTRGMVFATILWLGFAPGFSGWTFGTAPAFVQSGAGLIIYLIITLFAHLVYGAILGAGYIRLGGSERFSVDL